MNRLVSAEIVPTSIASGDKAKVEVTYKADAAATLRLDYNNNAFSVVPDQIPLPASQAGFKTPKITITRLGAATDCQITFHLFDDTDHDALEVR